MPTPAHDAIVVGAGHNGLTTAAYLARAGLRTLVLERRSVLGGACSTEERWPGYHVSRAAYVAGLLRPAVIRELGLHAHGLRLLRRDPSSFTPIAGDPGLLLGSDAAHNEREIARFSPRDARRYAPYEQFLDRTARALEPLLDAVPPALPRVRVAELPALLRSLARAVRLGRDLPRAIALLLGPARPFIEGWFESEPLRATLATDAVIGAFAAPSSPGTGYVLFHHVMGETGGARGVWAYVRGGMGALSSALARAARAAGAEIREDAPVARIAVSGARARGVVLENGEELRARIVISSADPQRTFGSLVEASELPDEFSREIATLDFRSPSLKINLALDRLPRFPGRASEGVAAAGPEHRGTIHVGALCLDAIEAAFVAADRGGLPERPVIELTLPSALDDSLAPAGHHVASLFVQYVPYRLARGSWETSRDAFADRVVALVDEVAPGFAASIVEREVLAPPDLEAVFGLTGGNIFHGAMSPDRMFFLRPLPDWARYRSPIDGLYLCGAGTHPGGGVMAACGRNAAREILRDTRRSR